jgi:hypothetical protein
MRVSHAGCWGGAMSGARFPMRNIRDVLQITAAGMSSVRTRRACLSGRRPSSTSAARNERGSKSGAPKPTTVTHSPAFAANVSVSTSVRSSVILALTCSARL